MGVGVVYDEVGLFFFSSRRRHTRLRRDWSSDVCSSDLPNRVMAGTDCGFDTSAGSNRVDKDIVWLKLASMGEGADLASQSYSW